MEKKNKQNASISLDLDNQWSYMKIHGDQGWENYPSYLPVFIPYILQLLEKLNLKITFFIVGKDADMDVNKKYIKMISEAGHELGNHSFSHDSWLHKFPREQLIEEVGKTQSLLAELSGKKPKGFRGPGFTWSKELLEVLQQQGIEYDASTLPTWIGPLARKYYFMTSSLSSEEKKERSELFGTWEDGKRRIKPYRWDLGENRTVLEIPVSTIPFIKVPFHLSYLLYLSGFSMKLMHLYLSVAIRFCKVSGTQPSFLLHPLDLIGGDQVKELAFFPGMDISSEKKVMVFKQVINKLSRSFQLTPMHEFSETISGDKLPEVIL